MRNIQLTMKEKKQVGISVISCVVFLVVTHSYRWMNSMFNHDSLLVIQEDHEWQISLGRIFNPLYVWLRGEIVAPGNVALFSSLFLIAAAILCIRILRIRKTISIILCCGFLTTFETLAYVNASFLLSLDLDMLALLFAVLGAYFFLRDNNMLYGLAGIISVTLSLGLFQSYIEVTILLVCLALLRDLLEGGSSGDAVKKGLRAAMLLLVSGLIYYVCLRIAWKITGVIPADTVNGLVKMKQLTIPSVFSLVGRAWQNTFSYLFKNSKIAHRTISSLLYCGLGIISLLEIIVISRRKCLNKRATVLIILILLLMPLGGNAIYVLSMGFKHSLMTYSFCFYSIFFVLIFDLLDFDSELLTKVRWIVPLMCSVLILNHVLFANQHYIRNDLHTQAGNAFMTRLVSRMETTENYIVGETPVLILGHIDENPVSYEVQQFSVTNDPMVGTDHHLAISYYLTYNRYFKYVMGYPINLIPLSEIEEYLNDQTIQAMPIYPAEGSLKMVDGVLVVRLSENLLPEELR